MDKHVKQLVEMGASPAQARAALKKYKDVMQAAERFFEGEFADVMDNDSQQIASDAKTPARSPSPAIHQTPQDDSEPEPGDSEDVDEDDDGDYDNSDAGDYIDYDPHDYGQNSAAGQAVDPYAGIFFSKDRREEVIEVEEEPETVTVEDCAMPLKLMTQGLWMKGCPEGSEQSFLFGIYSGLTEGECPCPDKCSYSIKRKKQDFFSFYPTFPEYTAHISTIARQTCPKCSTMFCYACGEPVRPERDHIGRLTLPDNPLFHCANLQGVILGVGLSMLEQLFAERVDDATIPGSKRKPVSQQRTEGDEDDHPYYMASFKAFKGKKSKNGIGYAGQIQEDQSGQLQALAAQRSKDERIGELMQGVRTFLPNLHRADGGKTSDYLPHPTALAHLRRRFNSVSSTLLRNDSLSGMSDRSVLYFELFEWLETISNHESLASMMAMPIMVVVSVKSVNTKKAGRSSRKIRERTIVYEGSSGPRELLESLVIQAQAASRGLEGSIPAEPAPDEITEEQKRVLHSPVDSKGKGKDDEQIKGVEENVRLLEFCHRIIATAAAIDRSLRDTKGEAFLERLKASLPKVPPRSTDLVAAGSESTVDAGMSDEELRKIYLEWGTRVRFEYCDLSMPPGEGVQLTAEYVPNFKHAYNGDAKRLVHADMPRRALAIAKELAVLTTNLPVAWDSSIFLRVDESRVDVIKALIIGPEGTPYQNGCYCFDVFLGGNYNLSPPSVKYMTTSGGRYRFNPNLYADGKVCLSLLGTWSGPGWVAGKSTLLQVLISIQSMILCDEPYCNEPSWQNDAGSQASRAYSANVRRMVVNTAMLGNLKNPPEPFADVIRTHFRLKARSIIAQLDQWLALDDASSTQGEFHMTHNRLNAGGSGSTFRSDVEEFKRLLRRLQTESAITSTSTRL